MKKIVLLLFTIRLFAADTPKSDAEKLAEAKAENAELRKALADTAAWSIRAHDTMATAVNACIGSMPQPPAPKPDPKSAETKP